MARVSRRLSSGQLAVRPVLPLALTPPLLRLRLRLRLRLWLLLLLLRPRPQRLLANTLGAHALQVLRKAFAGLQFPELAQPPFDVLADIARMTVDPGFPGWPQTVEEGRHRWP